LAHQRRRAIFGSYCGGTGVAWWALMIAFWVGLLTVVVWAVTRLFPSGATSADADEAVEGRLVGGARRDGEASAGGSGRTLAPSSGSNGSD
jgi:hypothetical protein